MTPALQQLRCASVPEPLNVFKQSPRDLLFNLVTVSGHDKDSSLCFFERTIRPDVMTSTQ